MKIQNMGGKITKNLAVLAGLGGGHFHDFAGTTLEKKIFFNVLLLKSYLF